MNALLNIEQREFASFIAKLTGTQARIALQAINEGKSLKHALEIAETYR